MSFILFNSISQLPRKELPGYSGISYAELKMPFKQWERVLIVPARLINRSGKWILQLSKGWGWKELFMHAKEKLACSGELVLAE